MANDATNKTASNSDPTETSSLAATNDQQKVPPLRIVLNSSSNQKASSTTISNQQTSTKKEKAQDARVDGTLKGGGRVRIKLGTNKQPQAGKANDLSETPNKRSTESGSAKSKDKSNPATNDKQEENINEESVSAVSHLRRITRRSQRTIQSITNEDDESISSMTSVDENLNTNTTQTNSDTTQDPEQSNPASSTSGTASNNATNGSSNTDTPRRYKRRKLESSESQSLEYDSLLGAQNYKLPHQNSFELFRNIRMQVEKRLKNLNCVQPKTPLGLRDYMLTRGAYLLDGNKLGNGTSLFMNEDGGLNTAPLGKYHVIRSNKTNYSVPNKAKVPVGIPVNSPLHGLFIEQERERYRMRIQHIKEREKLTLAAEQEFVRAYGQAALAAANQDEPFSVCTMLKHQEIYNYLDSDGTTILSREDAQQDQIHQPDGVRTRRRQHGQISPVPPTRKGSGVDESAIEAVKKGSEGVSTISTDKKNETNPEKSPTDADDSNKTKSQDSKQSDDKKTDKPLTVESATEETVAATKSSIDEAKQSERDPLETGSKKTEKSENKSSNVKVETSTEIADDKTGIRKVAHNADGSPCEQSPSDTQEAGSSKVEATQVAPEDQSESTSQPMSVDSDPVISDDERRAGNKDTFLAHLQEIDDKWDKIRREMLVRHRNEAESLHAIQKLEWEWKTKETGACDVRTTLVIDNTLVPKLDVLIQDY